MIRVLKWMLGLVMAASFAVGLSGCGGSDGANTSDIGPGEKALLGEWRQADADLSGDDNGVSLTDTVVIYNADGTSRFTAKLTLDDPSLPAEQREYAVSADVLWTLEETVLTRTLQDMTVTPAVETPESLQIASLYRDGLAQSPPGRFIVEAAEADSLVLLDVSNGQMLRFTR